MKVLKNGFILKDFSVTFMLNNAVKKIEIKDKGSKSQAMGQVIKEFGNKSQILEIKSMK